ncbi:MAG TPA: choice-of-anchor B family protein [Longimicrobiales bacterium]|nr:choice-of-anchor B family protein [Longimicrobiales bacterium]
MRKPRPFAHVPGRRHVLLTALLLTLPASAEAQQLYDFGSAFGRALAVSGSDILVGEPQNIVRPGRVYVLRTGGSGEWVRHQVLEAPDAVRADGFGRALAAGADHLLVGAPQATEGAGFVQTFRRTEAGWEPGIRISGGPGVEAAGSTVALSPAGGAAVSGAWVERTGAGERIRLLQSDGSGWAVAESPLEAPGDRTRFGAALAFPAPDALVVCGADAGGAVVLDLFRRGAGGMWSPAGEVRPGAPLSASGGLLSTDAYTQCGLSASGDRVAVGTPLGRGGRGEVVVYRFLADGLVRDTALAPPQGAVGGFGTSVAFSEDALWVGAPMAGGMIGAAARFPATADGWGRGELLQGPGTDFMPVFGLAVAAGPEAAVVGAPGDAYGAGLAVAYRNLGSGWSDGGVLEGEVEGYEPVTGERVDCTMGEAELFPCGQVDMVALLPVQQLGGSRGAMVNDVWGWTDPETGREYAVVGRSDGTSFVDVTEPANPVFMGQLPKTEGSRGNAWRDVKVLRNHALVVADNAGAHGMQIFDMTRLRDVDPADPPTFEADALYTEIASAHNLAVNEETGFAYTVGNSGGGQPCGSIHMIDLRDPLNPTFAGCYTDPTVGLSSTGGTHDAQCVLYRGPDAEHAGREICLAFSETAVSIGDVTDRDATRVLAQAQMPNTAYIHQGWLTDDHRYLYVNDELDEMNGLTDATRTMIWDLSDLDDPVLAGVYLAANNATDHNLYVRGNLMYQSNYAAGLRVIDITDPVNPREVAYFDTAPFAPEVPGFFDGSWSNYPFFESGNILVTSHKQGLFILRARPPIS